MSFKCDFHACGAGSLERIALDATGFGQSGQVQRFDFRFGALPGGVTLSGDAVSEMTCSGNTLVRMESGYAGVPITLAPEKGREKLNAYTLTLDFKSRRAALHVPKSMHTL